MARSFMGQRAETGTEASRSERLSDKLQ